MEWELQEDMFNQNISETRKKKVKTLQLNRPSSRTFSGEFIFLYKISSITAFINNNKLLVSRNLDFKKCFLTFVNEYYSIFNDRVVTLTQTTLLMKFKNDHVNVIYFFPSLRAGGILQILQSDWFREWSVFYDLAR